MKELNFDEIMNEIPVKTVLEYYGVQFNRYNKCRCPFHDDKNPSAVVNHNKLFCFACGKSFDTIDITRHFGAVKPLKEAAEIAGIDIQDYAYDDGLCYKDRKEKERRKLKLSEFNEFCKAVGIKNNSVSAIVGYGDEKIATFRNGDWIYEQIRTRNISSNPLFDMFETDQERMCFLYDKYIEFREKMVNIRTIFNIVNFELRKTQILNKIPYIPEIPETQKLARYADEIIINLDKKASKFFHMAENRGA